MNSSNTTLGSPLDGWYVRPRIRDELFAAFLTIVVLYLLVALSIFEYRHSNSKKKKTFRKKVENFLSKGSLCLVAVVFTFVRCLGEQIELRYGTVSDLACRIYQHQLVEVYHISLTCLYLLLWTRQLKMYKHRALRHLSSGCLRIFSYAIIVGIIAVSVVTATIYLSTFTLVSSAYGCVYAPPSTDQPPSSLPGMLLFLLAFVFQFSLLGLLVYPLIKHYKVHMCCSSKSTEHQTQVNIRKTITRLSICTTICVLSDCVASNLLVFVHDGITPIMFYANIYTVNLLFNIVAVICSFADWKKRLLPCYKKKYESVAVTTSVQSTSYAL